MLSGHTHTYSFHSSNNHCSFPTVINDDETFLSCEVSPENIKQVHLQYSIGGSKQYDSIIMSDESGRGYELINEA